MDDDDDDDDDDDVFSMLNAVDCDDGGGVGAGVVIIGIINIGVVVVVVVVDICLFTCIVKRFCCLDDKGHSAIQAFPNILAITQETRYQRRYQKRARKSSEHVRKAGELGECVIKRIGPLWPKDIKFKRQLLREFQEHKEVVASSGNKT
uniref:Uncharacterized protein n=1 Tax=Glossina austeni TaxID=7395 RepID=A0A1A9VE18_GLOAU